MKKKRSLGQVFKAARTVKGWTQEQTAKAAKINTNSYAKVERDEVEPTFTTVRALCKVLDIDISSLPD